MAGLPRQFFNIPIEGSVQAAAATADVPVLHKPDPQQLYERCIAHNTPALIDGVLEGWPCTHRWTDFHLLHRDGDAIVTVRQRNSSSSAQPAMFGDVQATEDSEQLYCSQQMPLRVFLDKSSASGKLYAARIPLHDQLPQLSLEVPPPDYFDYR